MEYKIGNRIEFYNENEHIIYGEIFRIKLFPKRYYVKSTTYIYIIKEKQIIKLV